MLSFYWRWRSKELNTSWTSLSFVSVHPASRSHLQNGASLVTHCVMISCHRVKWSSAAACCCPVTSFLPWSSIGQTPGSLTCNRCSFCHENDSQSDWCNCDPEPSNTHYLLFPLKSTFFLICERYIPDFMMEWETFFVVQLLLVCLKLYLFIYCWCFFETFSNIMHV